MMLKDPKTPQWSNKSTSLTISSGPPNVVRSIFKVCWRSRQLFYKKINFPFIVNFYLDKCRVRMLAAKKYIKSSLLSLTININIGISVIYCHWTKQKEIQNKLNCWHLQKKGENLSHCRIMYILFDEKTKCRKDKKWKKTSVCFPVPLKGSETTVLKVQNVI